MTERVEGHRSFVQRALAAVKSAATESSYLASLQGKVEKSPVVWKIPALRGHGRKMHKTIKLIIALSLSALTYSAIAEDIQECRKIQDSALRLKCFDEAPTPAVPTPKSKPPAQKVAIPSEAGWRLDKTKDQMTDRTSCVVIPVSKRYVQFSPGDLYISYHGRGGVQGFRYRIDDGPPSEMQLPTPVEKQISVVHISGPIFNQILSARRLRVEVLTMVSGLQNEDLPLAGMRPLYEKMIQECR